MEFKIDKSIKTDINRVLKTGIFPHIKPGQVIAFRSEGSKSRAIARIWSLPSIWQIALTIKPHYCIEVISHRFDKLSREQKTKVLIHELLHIPHTFSGALRPHRGRGIKVDAWTVNKYYKMYINKISQF